MLVGDDVIKLICPYINQCVLLGGQAGGLDLTSREGLSWGGGGLVPRLRFSNNIKLNNVQLKQNSSNKVNSS